MNVAADVDLQKNKIADMRLKVERAQRNAPASDSN